MVAHNTDLPKVKVVKTCKECGIVYPLFIVPEDLFDWHNGDGFIQDLMPYLTDGERELIISSTCGSCFDLMFDSLEVE